MTCPSCGGENPDTASFCALCLTDFHGTHSRSTQQSAQAVLRQAEQQELDDLRQKIEAPHLPPAPVISRQRLAAVLAASAVFALLVALVLDLLPIPFLWILGPLVGGVLAGRLLGDQGGRCGAVAVVLVAGWRVVLPFTASAANPQAVRAAVGTVASDVSTSAARVVQSAMTPSLASQIPAVAIAVALTFAAGYFGGRYGERLGRGVGHGL